jgi:hypothetical protein
MTKVNPKYTALEAEMKAYLDSVKHLPVDSVLERELRHVVPGIFNKHFPHKVRGPKDLDGVFELRRIGVDDAKVVLDKEFMELLKKSDD